MGGGDFLPNTPDLPVLITMNGVVEPITDFSEFKHKESTEGEKSLSFYVHKTESNKAIFDLIVNKEKIEFEGDKYVVDVCDREPNGTTVEKYIEARHEMFDRLKGQFIEEEYTGALRIERCLEIAFAGSGLTYEVIGTFSSREFENYGRANGLDLFKQIRDRFEVEFRVFGIHVIVAAEIASVTDAQFRHGHNLKSFSEHVDTTNLATFIKGFSYEEETGQLLAYAEYESPYSHLYKDENGIKRLIHADYVYDNRFRHNSEMLEYIKSQLQDAPEYNLQIEYEELKKNGFNLHNFELGDYVWAIYEPLDLDIQVRIISVERYPYDPHLSPVLELGSFRRDVTKEVAKLQGTAKRVDAVATKAQVTADKTKQEVSVVSNEVNTLKESVEEADLAGMKININSLDTRVTSIENSGSIVPTKTLKVLSIGNSFSLDAHTYIHEIAKSAGVNVIFGLLYRGGESLEGHWTQIQGNLSSYTYYKKTALNGVTKETITNNVSVNTGVADENWDIITVQQTSSLSGMYSTYQPYLKNILGHVRGKATNINMQFAAHMTWAYATTCTLAGFANYNNNQTTMFNAIRNAWQQAMAAEDIPIVIPSGTAIQNARSHSALLAVDEELTRDGYHLGTVGDYIAGLTFFEVLCAQLYKKDIFANISFTPTTKYVSLLSKIAVKHSVANPFRLTNIQ